MRTSARLIIQTICTDRLNTDANAVLECVP